MILSFRELFRMFRLRSNVLKSKSLLSLSSLSISTSSLKQPSKFSSISLITNNAIRNYMNNNAKHIIRYNSTNKDPTNTNSDTDNTSNNDKIDSNNKNDENTSNRKEIANIDDEYYDGYEEPVTPRDKVKHYFWVGLRLVFLVGGVACIGYLFKEMFPGRMSPNSLYSEAFEIVRFNDEIQLTCGDGMKAFGADRGRNEGRRNHIDSRQYVAEDGSQRTRVRFHVKGPRGHVIVWAEVSNNLDKPDLVYLICQDKRSGRVITIQDNRALLESRAAAGNKDQDNAISKLLGVFNK